jgi:hypothetical protein
MPLDSIPAPLGSVPEKRRETPGVINRRIYKWGMIITWFLLLIRGWGIGT